jgi:hypothetical protein
MGGGNHLRRHDLLPFRAQANRDMAGHPAIRRLPRATNRALKRLIRQRRLMVPGFARR